MPLPYIPETITVHLGPPGSDAANVTVPFPDYIKNVASSEIYPTWPEAALRANILAEVSFALNRVYTEWYRSQGYDYDITNSTAYDQSFVPGRDIFDNISDLVDEMFDDYLVRPGSVEPLFAQYCSGTTVTCEGLSQWGTVPLAEQGYTPYDILTTFYGDNLNIEYDAPTAPALGSYPGTPLRQGSGGNAVRTIQLRLNRISNNYPRIPKIYPVDGFFGADTEAAVRAFQEVFGLTPDGVVGKQTWYRIAYLYTAIARLAELDSEGVPLSAALDTLPQNLSAGMTGREIRLLQYLLAVIGYFYDTVPQIYITEVFDADTLAAVKAVQNLLGLTPDGIVGPQTWDGIVRLYRGILDVMPEWVQSAEYPLLADRLMEGSSGEQVARLQEWLTELSAVQPNIPAVPVTAYFGPQTEAAVMAAQQLYGQTPTGVVGPVLWSTLAREVQRARGEA